MENHTILTHEIGQKPSSEKPVVIVELDLPYNCRVLGVVPITTDDHKVRVIVRGDEMVKKEKRKFTLYLRNMYIRNMTSTYIGTVDGHTNWPIHVFKEEREFPTE